MLDDDMLSVILDNHLSSSGTDLSLPRLQKSLVFKKLIFKELRPDWSERATGSTTEIQN